MAFRQPQQIPQEILEILRPPYWDPIPPWLRLNEEILTRFAEMEIQFKVRELQLQQEKLEQFGKMIGP